VVTTVLWLLGTVEVCGAAALAMVERSPSLIVGCDLATTHPRPFGRDSFVYAADGSRLGMVPMSHNREQPVPLHPPSRWLRRTPVASSRMGAGGSFSTTRSARNDRSLEPGHHRSSPMTHLRENVVGALRPPAGDLRPWVCGIRDGRGPLRRAGTAGQRHRGDQRDFPGSPAGGGRAQRVLPLRGGIEDAHLAPRAVPAATALLVASGFSGGARRHGNRSSNLWPRAERSRASAASTDWRARSTRSPSRPPSAPCSRPASTGWTTPRRRCSRPRP
jgi:hypothetical protein